MSSMNINLVSSVVATVLLVSSWSVNVFAQTYTSSTLTLNNVALTMQPIFSPDNSESQIRAFIDSATTSLYIQNQYLYKQSTSTSWINSGVVNSYIMEGILNAHNRGVQVAVLLENATGSITAVDKYNAAGFLAAAGVPVRYNNGKIYFHNKGIVVDNSSVLISSINFSDTALLYNREAGIILYNAPAAQYFAALFATDWAAGSSVTADSTYTASGATSYTTSTAPTDSISHASISGVVSSITLFANPDNANAWVKSSLSSFTRSFHAEMYEITSSTFTNAIESALAKNLSADCTIIQSSVVVGDQSTVNGFDNILASPSPPSGTKCSLFSSNSKFTYQHAKFWIADGHLTTVFSGNWALTSATPSSYGYAPNREWGVTIDSTCVASVFESLLSSDRAIATTYATSFTPCSSYDACGVCNGDGSTCASLTWADGTSCSINSLPTSSSSTTAAPSTSTTTAAPTAATSSTTKSATTSSPTTAASITPSPSFVDAMYTSSKVKSSSWQKSFLSSLGTALALNDTSGLSISTVYTSKNSSTTYYHVVIEVTYKSANTASPSSIASTIITLLGGASSKTATLTGLDTTDLASVGTTTEAAVNAGEGTAVSAAASWSAVWLFVVASVAGKLVLDSTNF